MKKVFTAIYKILLYAFAAIGFVFTVVYIGMRFGAFNVRGSIAERNSFFGPEVTPVKGKPVSPCTDASTKCDWNATPEWVAIKGGLEKDQNIIQTVANETGVPTRMIASVVVPEQTRFFTANREIFKSYFEPLKLLGSLTQFSLGVSGIKEDTAKDIEKYALDPKSDFYPGDGLATLFAYPDGVDHDAELYKRLTDAKDHTYQYLYTALFIKEIEAQWTKAGFDITKSPEAVVTLFNLGFQASHPKAVPVVAGAPITTGGQTYPYGQLGANFYHSTELTDIFPQN